MASQMVSAADLDAFLAAHPGATSRRMANGMYLVTWTE